MAKVKKAAGKKRTAAAKKKKRPVASGSRTVATAGPVPAGESICVNAKCKLRKAGCYGFENCPGYKAK